MQVRRITPAVFAAFAAAGLAALATEPRPAGAASEKAGPPPLFVQKCAKCHGEDGRAQTEKGKKMKAQDFTDPDFQQHKKDEQLADAIANGTEKDMPAFGKVLTPAEIESMVQTVRAFGR